MAEAAFYAAIQLHKTDPQSPTLVLNDSLPFSGELKPNQVLIKIAYAAINPSDFMVMRGNYVVKKVLPAVPGTVGVGIVVATGRSWRSRWLIGKRVACAGNYTGDGTWGQYLLTTNSSVMPLQKRVSDEIGANLLSNPNTALAIIDSLRKRHVESFIHNAAAGDIGQLLQFAAKEHDIQVINIVRRPEQVELLRSKFGFPTLNSNAVTFDQELEELAHELNPTVFLDAVSGEMTSHIARTLAPKGQIILYGTLSGQPPVIDQQLFYQKDLRLEAFSITNWLREQSFPRMLRYTLKLQHFGRKYGGATIRGVVGLRQLIREWPDYEKQSGQGKFLLNPFLLS
jgi:NADPH:quinone reductase